MSRFSEDEDLDEVWQKIIQTSNEEAGWQLNSEGPSSVEEILSQIKAPKKESSQIHKNSKQVFEKSLICIKRVGAVIAQSASMVFGPSQQCFNAVNFVIDAVQKYEEVFVNITILMERMTAFLERLHSYLDQTDTEFKLDKRLRLTVHRALDHFLTVLGIWHKLAHKKSAKFTLSLKITVFGEDDGVKDAMTKLENLVLDVTRAEITTILQTISASARSLQIVDDKIDAIVNAQEKAAASIGRLEGNDDEKKQQRDIQSALLKESTKRPWIEVQDDLWGSRVPDTGEWLLEFARSPVSVNSFRRWADTRENVLNALCLIGAGQYGKTYLVCAVIHHLQVKYSNNSRVGIAYYYIGKDMTEQRRINNVFRAIIFQLASAPTALGRDYAKAIVDVCRENQKEFGKSVELWTRLVVDIGKKVNGTFFIVIDGIDEAVAEVDNPFASILAQIMSLSPDAALKIRIFFTSRAEGLKDLNDLQPSVPRIELVTGEDSDPLNQPDVFLCAESRLDQMQIFRSVSEDVKQLKDRAKSILGTGVRGDFYALNSKLDSLEKSFTHEDVEDVLSRAKDTRAVEIARDIQSLNDTLRQQEICELNEMLCWHAVCLESLTLEQFNAILEMKGETNPLVPLEHRITDRYSRLFTINAEDSTVTLRSMDILKQLQQNNDLSASRVHGHESSMAPILTGEVVLLRRLLKTHLKRSFGSHDVYERFGFDEFFKEKSSSETVRIRLASPADNHIQVAHGCLRAICDFPSNSFSALRRYSWIHFVDHLVAERDVDDADWLDDIPIDLKQDIGRKLVRILRNDPDFHVETEAQLSFIDSIYEWVIAGNYSKAVSMWLKNAEVQNGFQDMPADRQWIIENTATDKPAVCILQTVIRNLAQCWIGDTSQKHFNDDYFGSGYFLLRLISGYLSSMQGEEFEEWYEPLTLKRIDAIEAWAKIELGDRSDTLPWKLCFARALRNNGHAKDAIVLYRSIESMEGYDWTIKLEHAQTLNLNESPRDAAKELQALIEENQARLNYDGDIEYRKKYFESILLDLGTCLLKLRDFETAKEIYAQILAEALKRDTFETWALDAVARMATAYSKQTRHSDTIQLLRSLASRPDEIFGSWLHALLYRTAGNVDLHRQIRFAAHSTGQIDPFVDHYQVLVKSCRKMLSDTGLLLLSCCHLGSLVLKHGKYEQQEAALNLWEDDIFNQMPDDGASEYSFLSAQQQSAGMMATALFMAARAVSSSASLNSASTSHVSRLEKLSRHQLGESTSVKHYLTRLKYLSGDATQARDISRDLISELIEDAGKKNGKESLFKFGEIANILQCFDDDDNVLAAWQFFAPLAPEAKTDSPESNFKVINTHENNVCEEATTDYQELQTLLDRTEQPASSESTDKSRTVNPPDASLTGADSRENQTCDATNEDSDIDTNKPDINGTCDGCKCRWSKNASLWACKDCYDIQFCPPCHQKLINQELTSDVCSQTHVHLHIPFLTREEWSEFPEDHLRVSGSYVHKRDWLESLKKDWQIDTEKVQAAMTIQKFVRRKTLITT